MNALPAKDAKCGFGRLIGLARSEPVAVAKHGRPVVVVMAVEDRLKALESPATARRRSGRSAHEPIKTGERVSAMDKRTLTERDICTKFILPALKRAGWDEDHPIVAEPSAVRILVLLPRPDDGRYHWLGTDRAEFHERRLFSWATLRHDGHLKSR